MAKKLTSFFLPIGIILLLLIGIVFSICINRIPRDFIFIQKLVDGVNTLNNSSISEYTSISNQEMSLESTLSYTKADLASTYLNVNINGMSELKEITLIGIRQENNTQNEKTGTAYLKLDYINTDGRKCTSSKVYEFKARNYDGKFKIIY